jgi:hypothetical protein
LGEIRGTLNFPYKIAVKISKIANYFQAKNKFDENSTWSSFKYQIKQFHLTADGTITNSLKETHQTLMGVHFPGSKAVVIKLFCSRHTEESENFLVAHPNMPKW